MTAESQIEGIGNAMVQIADKIGIAVNEMFKIYTGVQYGFAFLDIASIVLPVLFFLIFAYFTYRHYQEVSVLEDSKEKIRSQMKAIREKQKMDSDYEYKKGLFLALDAQETEVCQKATLNENKMYIYGALTILLPIIVYFMVLIIGTAVLKIYYPEYFAIQTMLGQFGAMI